jgi:hypothetical protein
MRFDVETEIDKAIKAAYEAGKRVKTLHVLEPGIPVAVLYERNVDHAKAIAYSSTQVNEAWRPTGEKLIADGFVVFRLQTELGLTGHHTIAYFVKIAE